MKSSTKRPTHEADAMKLFLADSVAPRLAEKLVELRGKGLKGDQLFVGAVIALSRDPEFWANLAEHAKLAEAAKNELLRLREAGRPVSRSWLKALREAAARLGFEPMKSWDILVDGFAGIKITTDLAVDCARKVFVDIFDGRRRVETFELPVAEELEGEPQ